MAVASSQRIALLNRIVALFFLALLSPQLRAEPDISFQLALLENRLTLTPLGTAAAFYPTVLRMRPDGGWDELAAVPITPAQAQMRSGEARDFIWPAAPSAASPNDVAEALRHIQPLMVRYREMDGVAWGQVAFLNPPETGELLEVAYSAGALHLALPQPGGPAAERLLSTWVVWPAEDGIERLAKPLDRRVHQPPAQHVDWRTTTRNVLVDTGPGQPDVWLLHETSGGYRLQVVAGVPPAGRQQRAFWLTQSGTFYGLAALLAVLAWMTGGLAQRRGCT